MFRSQASRQQSLGLMKVQSIGFLWYVPCYSLLICCLCFLFHGHAHLFANVLGHNLFVEEIVPSFISRAEDTHAQCLQQKNFFALPFLCRYSIVGGAAFGPVKKCEFEIDIWVRLTNVQRQLGASIAFNLVLRSNETSARLVRNYKYGIEVVFVDVVLSINTLKFIAEVWYRHNRGWSTFRFFAVKRASNNFVVTIFRFAFVRMSAESPVLPM